MIGNDYVDDDAIDPRDYVMPVGEHAGESLAEIAETENGQRYLIWVLESFDPGETRSMVEDFLEEEGLA